MAERIKVRIDRQFRGTAEVTERVAVVATKENPRPRPRVKAVVYDVPQGGPVNAGDACFFEWEVDEDGKPSGDPYLVSLETRTFERRSWIEIRAADATKFELELRAQGWKGTRFEGPGEHVFYAVAHTRGSSARQTAESAGCEVYDCTLELIE